MRKLLIAGIFSCFILFACKKDEQKTLGTPPLQKSITSCCGDSTAQMLYAYNNLGALIGIKYSDNNGHWSNIDFTYNNQGKLVGAKDTADYNGGHTISFDLDISGNIIKRYSYSSFGGSPFINSYAYDNNGRLVADSAYNYWSAGIGAYSSYSYDQNGNVVTKKSYRNNGGTFHLEATLQMQYDNNPNPFYDLKPLFYSSQWDICLSRNNCIVSNDGIHPPNNYSFQYNPDDSPSSWTLGPIGTFYGLHGNYFY